MDTDDIMKRLGGGELNQAQLDMDDPQLMAELRAMGWEDQQELDQQQLDVADLEREMADQQKRMEKQLKKHSGKQYSQADIQNMQLDEGDLQDPDLLDELNEIGGQEAQAAMISQYQKRAQELQQQIKALKQQALKYKQSNDRQNAVKLMKQAKSLQVELASNQQVIQMHSIAKKKQKPPESEQEFDYQEIVSMSVLEYQSENATSRDLKQQLDMAINLLSTNIQAGLVDIEDYSDSLRVKINQYESLVQTKSGKMKKRLLKHIQLMKQELEQAEEEDEEQQEEQEEEEKGLSHQELLVNNLTYKAAYEMLEELKQAFNYLKNIGSADKIQPIMKHAQHLNQAINQFRAGKSPKVNLDPLLPQHITGIQQKARRTRLLKLQKFCSEQQAFAKQRALQSLKIKDNQTAKQYKTLMVQCQSRAKSLQEALQNPWQIPPNVSVRQITKKVLALNQNLNPGQLSVKFGLCTGMNESRSHYIRYTVSGSGNQITHRTASADKISTKGFKISACIDIPPKIFSSLFRRRMKIEVVQYHMIRSDKVVGSTQFKLEDFSHKCTLQQTVNLGRGPTLELELKIRQALQTPQFKTETEDVQYVEPLVPPFRSLKKEVSQPAPVQKQTERQPQSQKQSGQSHPLQQTKNVAVPASLSPQEISNPGIIDNLNSYEVLEYEMERLNKVIIEMRSSGKDPGALVNHQREVMKKKMIIQTQVGNGIITPEQYKEVLNTQIQHDLVLGKYFKDLGDRKKLEIVANRVKMMKAELTELEQQKSQFKLSFQRFLDWFPACFGGLALYSSSKYYLQPIGVTKSYLEFLISYMK